MTDLATRLKAATEGSRELSSLVLLALGWEEVTYAATSSGTMLRAPSGMMHDRLHPNLPDPARSVDDGLALLRGTGALVHLMQERDGTGIARIDGLITEQSEYEGKSIKAATPALALSAALVRAKEQETASE